jgi:hypothetical protein
MSELFRQHLIEFMESVDHNGVWSDEDCEAEEMVPLSPGAAIPIVTRWAIEEVQADINAGIVPKDVRTFASLHNHVDANKYGGAFDWPALVGDISDEAYLQAHCEFWNDVQAGVDRWLRASCS